MQRTPSVGRRWIARIWAILDGPPKTAPEVERQTLLADMHAPASSDTGDLFANLSREFGDGQDNEAR